MEVNRVKRLESFQKAYKLLPEEYNDVRNVRELFEEVTGEGFNDYDFRLAVNDLYASGAIGINGKGIYLEEGFELGDVSIPDTPPEALLAAEWSKEIDPDDIPVYTDHLKRHYDPLPPDLDAPVVETRAQEDVGDFRTIEYWLSNDTEEETAELTVRSVSISPPLHPDVAELFLRQEKAYARSAWRDRESKLREREEPKGGGSWASDTEATG